jgi:hypothetical protein
VHYHPGKANVVADALSRKAHCHCLSIETFSETLCYQMRKLNLEIIPQGSLNLLSIEPTLQDRIIISQMYLKIISFVSKSLMKHIYPSFLFTLVVQKCTKTLGKTFGGPE